MSRLTSASGLAKPFQSDEYVTRNASWPRTAHTDKKRWVTPAWVECHSRLAAGDSSERGGVVLLDDAAALA